MSLIRKLLSWRDPIGSYESLPTQEPLTQFCGLTIPRFSYQGLEIDSKAHMIRLLELLPGQRHEFIRCTLTTAYLSENTTKYEALSYCWGDSTIVGTIYCNDRPVSVTTNLRDALRQLRYTSSPRVLWVDALCINQQDVGERNEQVPLMCEIYSKCRRVVIWLGQADAHSREGFWLIERLSSTGLLRRETFMQRPQDVRHVLNLERHRIPLLTDSRWESFCTILRRPYFRRTWVVQELVLASRAVVVCGEDSTDWTLFPWVTMLMFHMNVPAIVQCPQHESIASIDLARTQRLQGESRQLFEQLLFFNRQLATDPLDKIYGLLGIASDCGPSGLNIPVNYSLSPAELYRFFAVAMLKGRGNLDVLSIPRPRPLSDLEGLPSWAPDWGRVEANKSIPLPRDRFRNQGFQASKGTRYSPNFEHDNILKLEGLIFKEIQVVGALLTAPELPQASFVSVGWTTSSIVAKLYLGSAWLVCAHSGPVYRTGGDMIDAYWQTLLAGCDSSEIVQKRALFRNMFLYQNVIRSVDRLCVLAPHYIFHFVTCLLITFVMDRMGWLDLASTTQWDYSASTDRRIIMTEDDWMGLAPAITEPGDTIVIVKGGDIPLVLRRKGHSWEFIGEIYVHGIMHGEAFDEDACQSIWLV